jgi:hypothetical protein
MITSTTAAVCHTPQEIEIVLKPFKDFTSFGYEHDSRFP